MLKVACTAPPSPAHARQTDASIRIPRLHVLLHAILALHHLYAHLSARCRLFRSVGLMQLPAPVCPACVPSPSWFHRSLT